MDYLNDTGDLLADKHKNTKFIFGIFMHSCTHFFVPFSLSFHLLKDV